MWKILEGLVPNIFLPICTKTSDQRRRTYITSPINVGRLGTLEYNRFRWRAIHLFNQLPLFVRNATVCYIHSFKKQMDIYLSTMPDSLCQPGFNNSLDHGDCLRWLTPRDGLARNEMQPNKPKVAQINQSNGVTSPQMFINKLSVYLSSRLIIHNTVECKYLSLLKWVDIRPVYTL